MAGEFTKAVVDALAAHFQANIEGIAQVLTEWPGANITLKYPSLTIMTKEPNFQAYAPRLRTQGETDVLTNQAESLYVVGQYDTALQFDIWAKNKVERAVYYDLFFKAFNKEIDPMGLRLQLENYYNEWCNVTMTGLRYEDDSVASQTQAWRVIVDAQLTCNAILSKTEYIITQPPGLQFETPAKIE